MAIKLGNQEITLRVGSAECRVYLGDVLIESGDTPTPPTPSYKWLATYTGGTTSSAQCDASSAITQNEIDVTDLVAVEIGDCVRSLDNGLFIDCGSLTSATISDSVTRIGESSFSGCYGLTNVTIPSGVTYIDGYAFEMCRSLTSITIPSGVTTISEGVFANCESLSSIIIPSGVTSIGDAAFNDCTSLSSITIPSGVTSIGSVAFYGCTSLNSVTVLAPTPPTFGDGAFWNGPSRRKIYVPAQSVSAYQSASGWSDYASQIQAIP